MSHSTLLLFCVQQHLLAAQLSAGGSVTVLPVEGSHDGIPCTAVTTLKNVLLDLQKDCQPAVVLLVADAHGRSLWQTLLTRYPEQIPPDWELRRWEGVEEQLGESLNNSSTLFKKFVELLDDKIIEEDFSKNDFIENRTVELESLLIAASRGIVDAQRALGKHYLNKSDFSYDPKQALEWFEKAASQNDYESYYYIGIIHKKGLVDKANIDLACQYFDYAARGNFALAQYEKGMCYLSKQYGHYNPHIAFESFEKAANQGVREAQYQLAYCYFDGVGTNVDLNQGIYWCQIAAKQKLAIAQFGLGYLFYNGKNVKKNKQAALSLLLSSLLLDNTKNLQRETLIKELLQKLNTDQIWGALNNLAIIQNPDDFDQIVNNWRS